VAVLISKDGDKLSEVQVKTWVDYFRASLKMKRGKEPDPKDEDKE
jgi:hypothetical protein